MTTKEQTITTTSGQTYKVLNGGEEMGNTKILGYMVELKNGKCAMVYAYPNGLVKKVTQGM